MHLHTQLVNFAAAPEDPFRPTSTPIYQTATFEQESPEQFGRYDYSRSGNPTRDVLQSQLARLEHASAGGALAYASGVASIAGVLGLLTAGDEILAGDDLYGGTFRLLERIAPRRGLKAHYADAEDADTFASNLTTRTRLVYLETPTNPLLRIADIRAVRHAIGKRAAELGIATPILCVDNTACTPYLQNPLNLGASVVIHSATKGLCGHADVTAGALCTSDPALLKDLAYNQNAEGTALGPMDSFLLLRGMKTLAVRIRQQQESAGLIARALEQDRAIDRVYYPGLSSHPGAAVHAGQARGAGTVLSIRLGSRERAATVAKRLKLFTTSVSFGSLQSSVSLPACMSHASVPPSLRSRVLPPDDLLRLSIGLEDPGDLLADLTSALDLRTASRAALAPSSRNRVARRVSSPSQPSHDSPHEPNA